MTEIYTNGARPLDATITLPPTATPQDLRGRAMGVFVGAVFGLLWAASALSPLSAGVAAPVLVASIAISAVLVIGGLRVRRAATALALLTPGQVAAPRQPMGARFALVVAGEGAAILAAVRILAGTGNPLLIPAVICAAVGLHFVPLATLFHVKLYFGTAAALCLVSAATVILVPTTGAPSWLWQVLPGFGAAVALWTTSALMTVTSLVRPGPGRIRDR